MKNPIKKVLSKPVIWYLRFKRYRRVNIVINVDGIFVQERDFAKEEENRQTYERFKRKYENNKN